MAESIASVPGGVTFTLGGADVATRIDLPNNARRLRLYFATDPGKVAFDGTDGGAIDANYFPVVADAEWQVFVDRDTLDQGRGPASVYVATAAGGTTVRAICEAG